MFKIDSDDIVLLVEFQHKIDECFYKAIKDVSDKQICTSDIIESLKDELNRLEDILSQEKPYVNGEYNPNYGDNRICKCGHTYVRHFDPYEWMDAVGCKYCGCDKFVERKVIKKEWSELSNDAKRVLEWSGNIVTGNHDIIKITIGEYFDRPKVAELETHILITDELFDEIVNWCLQDESIDVRALESDYCIFNLKKEVILPGGKN